MITDILDEHLEEAEILWSRRRGVLRSSSLSLLQLGALEARLEAHLDGIAPGLDARLAACDDALAASDEDRAFVAAALLLRSGAPGHPARVLERFSDRAPASRRGILDALCHLPLAGSSRRTLEGFVGGADESSAAAGLEVLGFHRVLDAGLLPRLARADASELRLAVAQAAGRLPVAPEVIDGLARDRDVRVRDAALQAAIQRGLPDARAKLREVAASGAATRTVLGLLACVGDAQDVALLRPRVTSPVFGEAALAGLATLGIPATVPMMLEAMELPFLARAAGQAFVRLTGIELPEMAIAAATPEEEDARFEDLRPVPDATATRKAWRERADGFDPGLRWRGGRRLRADDWIEDPHRGDLLTRREELMRLWATRPGTMPAIELDAPAARQRSAG